MNDYQEIINYQLFTIAGTTVDVGTLIVSIVLGIVAYLLGYLAERGTIRFLKPRVDIDEGSVRASARLIHYIILAIGLAVAINNLGINLTALFTAGAVFAIALGFAMQNIAQNFVSGLILLIERTLKPGDIIEIEGRMVRITNLGMRATIVRTWDAEDYIIPNNVLVTSTVKNLTLRDRLYRIRVLVGVSYNSDMKKVRQVLEERTRDLEWRDPKIDPVILMKAFGSSSVDFDVSVWVNDPWIRAVGRSDLHEAIWFALKEAGITIAYPQLDMHLDNTALAAFQKGAVES